MSDAPSPRARFVVGTGRCGSTLLSKMLACNDEVLSLFEFFSGIDASFRFRPGPVDAAELARRLEEDHPMLTAVLARGYEVPEVVYPFERPGARFRSSDPIPWTLAIAIARISDDPDALFDEMLAFVRGRPRTPLADHYRAILDWLTARTGKTCWIERSGSSMEFAASLKACFPEARFVHLHRDGAETALSMREYAVLRLAVSVMNGRLGEVEYSHDPLSAFVARNADAIDATLASRPPIELFGAYWSDQIEAGLAALAEIDPRDVLEVRFEELVTEPARVLGEIAAFFGIEADGRWLARACALARGLPPLRRPGLDSAERERLDDAVVRGARLLARGPGDRDARRVSR